MEDFMNNNNKFQNKNQSNQNENVEKNYNKNASQSNAVGQKTVEPKHGKTESSKELNRSEANYESSKRESKR